MDAAGGGGAPGAPVPVGGGGAPGAGGGGGAPGTEVVGMAIPLVFLPSGVKKPHEFNRVHLHLKGV